MLGSESNRSHTKKIMNLHVSPPSIPSGDFRFGYKIEEGGHNMISLKQLFK